MGRKIFRGDLFLLLWGFFFIDLKLTPSSSLSFLFACRMIRGHKEVSTIQAGRRRGTPREMPTARSLVAAMSGIEVIQPNSYRN